ncbi:MAG: Threonine dehydratase, catabolic @ L-serine dehydratase, (PLP)-dependent [uncultured Gemmatimonadetes bacterium]|uniref:Threonine dehydratase, catabolic @ L-serine dehydratase, (PLP)-dependent n=1 Tax=uncultured Gemmatimonadota bacterium TaxID=203437 RepID=A0A6J4K6I5_9BACT|nr:MAG: Threonine dehydratase, catabolic @ L-serine dehydratase, (PLP)-dependent [uncultured Gemmatimonadota bacterium]
MVELRDIEAARERIQGQVVLTPCTPSETFGEMFGGNAWFKFENLQRTGSFKERGALNRMLQLPPEQRLKGVIAASAGNHAQGVAYHAQRLGIPATIVMPERTPLVKVSNTRKYGARVVLHGSVYDEAMAEALRIRDEEGATLVHPFDDAGVIAGQGTIGLELLEQCPQMDAVVVSVGGGGIIAGIAAAIKAVRPEVRVIGVESSALPAALRSREAGELVTIPPAETIAEGIAVRRIGDLTFQMIEKHVDELVAVSEEEIASAVLLLLEREKTVVEAACAAVVAAVVNGYIAGLEGKNVVMLLSGGNIDVSLMSRIIERGLVQDGRLAHLVVRVRDRPGALASLTAALAELGANVVSLDHRRGYGGLWLTEAEVALTLEMRGRDHVEELTRRLTELGYSVHRE